MTSMNALFSLLSRIFVFRVLARSNVIAMLMTISQESTNRCKSFRRMREFSIMLDWSFSIIDDSLTSNTDRALENKNSKEHWAIRIAYRYTLIENSETLSFITFFSSVRHSLQTQWEYSRMSDHVDYSQLLNNLIFDLMGYSRLNNLHDHSI